METAAQVSDRERVGHVVRRLGIGASSARVASTSDTAEAIASLLDVGEPQELDVFSVPKDWEDVEDEVPTHELVMWWVEQMVAPRQPLVERMAWFWHDHFATSSEKVGNSYLMWRQHAMVRRHALGNFRDLLHEIARDPAMLYYLDGVENRADAINENYGREVMELHTMGLGNYTQEDVVAAARAFTGWMVSEPDYDLDEYGVDVDLWESALIDEYHDGGFKSFLGNAGRLGMPETLDAILGRPVTGPFVAAKLYRELVGLDADPATAKRLGRDFATDWEIHPLVEAIVGEPAFLSNESIGAKIRTPLEKVVTLFQSFERSEDFDSEWFHYAFGMQAYMPFDPPNPAGFPKGRRLLSPGQLIGAFGLLSFLAEPERLPTDELFHRLGLFDVDGLTRTLVNRQRTPAMALAVAFGSPEFMLT